MGHTYSVMKFTAIALAALAAVSAKPTENSLDKRIAKETQQVDHAFLMDCTGSMGSYIATAKEKILFLVKNLKAKYPDMKLRLAFIGYRDVDDWIHGEQQYIFVPFTEDEEEFKTQIAGVQATGGGDFPEDVYVGLKAGVELEWKSNIRMMTLLSDAPHNEGEGRKKYEDFKPVLEKLADTGTDFPFVFTFFKIGDGAKELGEKLESMIPENMEFNKKELQVQSMYRPRPYGPPPGEPMPYPMPRIVGKSFGGARGPVGEPGPVGRPRLMSKSMAFMRIEKPEADAVSLDEEAAMEVPELDKKDDTYMSILTGYIETAVDKAAKKLKEEHATEA